MFESSLLILLVALVLDWRFGEPDILWSRFPHPVVAFGKAVGWIDKRYNIVEDSKGAKIRKGSLGIAMLILAALLVGLGLEFVVNLIWPVGWLLEVFIVFALLAQRSLHDHVLAVADGLENKGIQGGREAVGMIVGRDPSLLDRKGVCRASIESLAENFSDGVLAPAFWYAVFGLPGMLVYKMINTADSMIAYKNDKYIWFGRSAAQIDDLANWLPARLSAFLIAFGSFAVLGSGAFFRAIKCAFRDAGLHSSPNAGWPEAAMAGGATIALGGPRTYAHETVSQPFLNAAGEPDLHPHHIALALTIFTYACFAGWAICLIFLVL